jgi:sulfur-carrier protein adenylyltransferase/sulfurtransferase
VLFASVYQYEGQMQLVRGDDASTCLRCVWPEATRDGLIGNCAEAGVLGPVPGVLGSLQALEALKFLLNLRGLDANEILLFDLITLSTQRLRARRDPQCQAHASGGVTAPAATTDADSLEVEFASLADAVDAGYALIDVRDAREVIAEPLPVRAAHHLPTSKLLTGAALLDVDRRYLLVCVSGKRSAAAADLLRSQGLCECRSLRGGLKGLKTTA